MSARPFTAAHPDCARLLERQLACSERMARMKSRLIDGDRKYTPAVHTDIRSTFAQIRALSEPPVALVQRRAAK